MVKAVLAFAFNEAITSMAAAGRIPTTIQINTKGVFVNAGCFTKKRIRMTIYVILPAFPGISYAIHWASEIFVS